MRWVRTLGARNEAVVMLELGAYWSSYTLWIRRAIPDARVLAGRAGPPQPRRGEAKTLRDERRVGGFIATAVGEHGTPVELVTESDGERRTVTAASVNGLLCESATPTTYRC